MSFFSKIGTGISSAFKGFWSTLEKKGRYASLVGLVLSLPSAVIIVYKLYKVGDYNVLPFAIALGIGMIFMILPSEVTAKWGDKEFTIKD